MVRSRENAAAPVGFGPSARLPRPYGRLRGFIAATLLLGAALLLLGCGTVIDRQKLEDTIAADLERAGVSGLLSVSCPADVEVDPGRKLLCTVRLSGGRTETATLLIRNRDADVSLVNLQPDK
jgi:hypothetical protein